MKPQHPGGRIMTEFGKAKQLAGLWFGFPWIFSELLTLELNLPYTYTRQYGTQTNNMKEEERR